MTAPLLNARPNFVVFSAKSRQHCQSYSAKTVSLKMLLPPMAERHRQKRALQLCMHRIARSKHSLICLRSTRMQRFRCRPTLIWGGGGGGGGEEAFAMVWI